MDFGGNAGTRPSQYLECAFVPPNKNMKIAEDVYFDKTIDIYTINWCRNINQNAGNKVFDAQNFSGREPPNSLFHMCFKMVTVLNECVGVRGERQHRRSKRIASLCSENITADYWSVLTTFILLF